MTLANQVGKRYLCTKCNTEMIVTKAGDGELGCCGQPMQQKHRRRIEMPNQLGKRFVCETCNTEVLCIKAGEGAVECCGVAMELMQPKVLPSALD